MANRWAIPFLMDLEGSRAPLWPHDGALHHPEVRPGVRQPSADEHPRVRRLDPRHLRMGLGVLQQDEERLDLHR